MTFEKHCSQTEQVYDGLFLFSDVKITYTVPLLDFIIFELIKTRLDYDSLGYSFETIANLKKVESENIPKSWDVIKKHIEFFPINTPNYNAIENELSTITRDESQIENTLSAIKQLHDISKHALESNINALELDMDKKIGFVGEMFAYLYARDI